MTETSTLLVESTDSSMQHTDSDQSHTHFLDVLHQSLPVPQSHATALTSITSGELCSMGTGYATSLCTSPGSQGSHSSEVSGTEPAISPAVFI